MGGHQASGVISDEELVQAVLKLHHQPGMQPGHR